MVGLIPSDWVCVCVSLSDCGCLCVWCCDWGCISVGMTLLKPLADCLVLNPLCCMAAERVNVALAGDSVCPDWLTDSGIVAAIVDDAEEDDSRSLIAAARIRPAAEGVLAL